MKRIISSLLLLFFVSLKAQVPTMVVDVVATNTEPLTDVKFSKSNYWNGKYYYRGNTAPNSNLKLCATDGTESGTSVIKEFNITSVSISEILAVKDFLYIVIDKGVNGNIDTKELWKTDGTSDGTVLIKDFSTNTAVINNITLFSDNETNENYTINENEIYFAGASNNEGLELWKTNGTEASTVLVKDVNPGTNSSQPRGFVRLGNTVYFAIGYYNTYPFSEFWKSNGTGVGTVAVGTEFTVLNKQIVPFKGKMYFYGYDPTNGLEPWVSDGTVVGTTILKNTSPQTQYYYSGPFRVLKSENYLIFPQENYLQNSTTNHFWKSDGTTTGTLRMTPDTAFPIFINSYSNTNYTADKNDFYMTGSGRKVYKFNLIDNTNQIITMPASTEPLIDNLKVFESELWLTYRTSTNGRELWKTNFVTTAIFADLNVGTPNSSPFGSFTNNNNLYFFANNNTGNKLYSVSKDVLFNGNVSNNWSDAGNWASNTIPTITDNVIIPSNKNMIVDSNSFAKSVSVNSPISFNGGDLSVTGNLNLASKITLNNNNLNFTTSNASVTGNNINYIVSNGTGKVTIENLDTSRGVFSLPIGTVTDYNPISISNSGTSDTFSINLQNSISNTTGGAVNATWNIQEATAGNSNVNITLSWNASQENPLFNRNTSAVGHYFSSNWNAVPSTLVTGTNPYSIAATGITSFSPFGILNQSALNTNRFSEKDFSVLLYPNPTKGEFKIEVTKELVGAEATVYNLTGLVVSRFKLNDLITKQYFKSGIYLVSVEKGKQSITQKLLVN